MKIKMECPNGCGPMKETLVDRIVTYKGIDLPITSWIFVCDTCQLEVGTKEQTAKIQEQILHAYNRKTGSIFEP